MTVCLGTKRVDSERSELLGSRRDILSSLYNVCMQHACIATRMYI